MPCSDGGQSGDEARELKIRLDNVTELLCSVGRAQYRREPTPDKVLKWWEAHRRHDEHNGKPW